MTSRAEAARRRTTPTVRIGQVGVSVNYATLIGHGTIRRAVLGTTDRAPNASELTRMRALVWRGMAGFIGSNLKHMKIQ